MSIFKILVGFLFCGAAWGASLNVSWTNPVTNVDGSTIPVSGPGSLVATRVEYGSCVGSAFGVQAGEVIVNAPAANASFTVGPGTYCVRAFARNTYGSESAASNVSSKLVPAPVPNPPIVVVAVVAGINMAPVFKLTATGKRSPEAAGFALVNTPCTGNVLFYYRNHGYRRIDPAAVLWWNVVPSTSVAAPCAPEA